MQIDFVPSAVVQGQDIWTPAEPLAWGDEAFVPEASLARLAERFPSLGAMRTQFQAGLVDFQNRRLEQILSFLEMNSVDLCVFPEYSFIIDSSTLRILAGFAPRITIVAGLGVPRRTGVEAFEKYSADRVPQGANVAVVFSGTDCHLIAKKHPAEGEAIVNGNGIRVIPVETAGRELNLGVAICKDYLVAGPSLGEVTPVPDILAIPTYSSNLSAFQPDAPRDFPRIVANHARFGGSTIFAAGCHGRFVENGTPRAIPVQAEGILSIEWYGPPERPTALRQEQNHVTLRSAMISGSDGKSAVDVVHAFNDLTQGKVQSAELLEQLPRWLDYTQEQPRLALVTDALKLYRQASNDDLLTPELAEQLCRHFVAPETQSVPEHRRAALSTVLKQINLAIRASSDDLEAHKVLLNALEKYSVARGDEQPSVDVATMADGDAAEVRHYFSIGLGRYDSEVAVATLSDQQDLLLMFARSAPAQSRVTYRLETIQEPATGNIFPHFYVDFFGPLSEESKEYFTSLERIARSVLRRGWETYGADHQLTSGYRIRITPKPGVYPKMRGDIGFLVDVMRATGGGCVLEITGIRAEPVDDEPIADVTEAEVSEPTPDMINPLSWLMYPGQGNGAQDQGAYEREAITWFMTQRPGSVKIGVNVTLTTPERNDALSNLVGTALFGVGDWEVTELDEETADATASAAAYPVEIAHRILHPPHGSIEGRGLSRSRPLFRPITNMRVMGDGAVLGIAKVARPYVDDEMEIRIPDPSRLLHTYLIGRTGAGKTNTLKNIARHDLARTGPVIIIDPHGDLYDYAIKHAAFRENLIALDFSGGSRVPSLNPLYLDAGDSDDIAANIEQFIELTLNSTYFEWAGPRFSDLLRMCLETLVAAADEAADDWAFIGNVLRIIEDKSYRQSAINRLRATGGYKRLIERWEVHGRMRDTEQAEVEQWFISKFGDFRRPGGLSEATKGKPSVNLKAALERNAAVLVKAPATALGSAASRFLGSFIVERVLRYTMEGVFLGGEVPASLIVDEFQNFVGTSFVTLIPEARKFNLGITVANQTLNQLSNFSPHEGLRNDGLSQIILGNVGNLIIQSVGRHDAERLAVEVGMATSDLSRVGKYTALVQLTVNGERVDPFTVRLSASGERPGAVAGAVAVTQAAEALERFGQEVEIPQMNRPQAAGQAPQVSQPQAPPSAERRIARERVTELNPAEENSQRKRRPGWSPFSDRKDR